MNYQSASSFLSPFGPYMTIKRKSLSGAINISFNFDFILRNERSFVGSKSLTIDLLNSFNYN